MHRRLAALAALSLVPFALPLQSASAAPHRVRIFADCVHTAYQPQRIQLACVNQEFVMTKVHYKSWTMLKARGTDRTYTNQCQPSCDAGRPRYHAGDHFIIDCPVDHDGTWLFTRVRIYRDGALFVTWPLETAAGQWPYPSYGRTAPACQPS